MQQIKLIALVVVAVFLMSGIGAAVGAKPLPAVVSSAHAAGKGLHTAPPTKCERSGGKNPCAQKALAYIIAPEYSGKVSMPNDRDMERMVTLTTKEWDVSSDRVFKAREASDTTKDAIKTKMKDLVSKTTKDDLVVIYYAGHIARDKQTGGTFIAPPNAFNAGSTDPEVADESKCISPDEFASWVDAIPSKNTLVIFDACHSDGMVTTTLNGDKYATLASSKVDETSGGPPDGAGYFTIAFADAFEDSTGSADTNRDGWISVGEAFHAAQEKMFKWLGGCTPELAKAGKCQTPQMHGGGLSSDCFKLVGVKGDTCAHKYAIGLYFNVTYDYGDPHNACSGKTATVKNWPWPATYTDEKGYKHPLSHRTIIIWHYHAVNSKDILLNQKDKFARMTPLFEVETDENGNFHSPKYTVQPYEQSDVDFNADYFSLTFGGHLPDGCYYHEICYGSDNSVMMNDPSRVPKPMRPSWGC
ncbi:MAG: caspase family protein [Halobacteriota archaeon]